jgi:hypothetical protein
LTYILIAPSFAWAMSASYNAGRGRLWITLALVTTYIFELTALERLTVGVWPAVLVVQPCGVLLFLGWLLFYGSSAELWPGNPPEPANGLPADEAPIVPHPGMLTGPGRGAGNPIVDVRDSERRAA